MNKPVRIHYGLRPRERAALGGLLQNAFAAADDFRGAEGPYRALFTRAAKVERFIRRRAAGNHAEAFERAVTAQVEQPTTISAILDRAAASYTRALRAGTAQGAVELSVPFVLIPPDPDPGGIVPGDGTGAVEPPHFMPREQILRAHLNSIGIYEDDLIIQRGELRPGQMRQRPYVLIDIPKLDAQICVCDQVGEATFVKRGMMPVEHWASYTKTALEELPGVTRVICNNEAQWLGDIAAALSDTANAKKVDVRAEVAKRPKRFLLSEEFILFHAKLHFERHSELPSAHSGEVEGLSGEKWYQWNEALTGNKKNGAIVSQRGVGPNLSLAKLYQKVGWRLGELSSDIILRLVKQYQEQKGQLPTEDSGIINGYFDETWTKIDQALRKDKCGLNKKSSLSQFYQDNTLIKKKLILTERLILAHALKHFRKYKTLPGQASGSVETLPDEKWSVINICLTQGIRGLSGGSNLQKLYEEKGWRLGKLTEPLIAGLMLKHFVKHGRLPNVNSGTIDDMLEGTWSDIRLALKGNRGKPSRGVGPDSSLVKLADKYDLLNKAIDIRDGRQTFDEAMAKITAQSALGAVPVAVVMSAPTPIYPAP